MVQVTPWMAVNVVILLLAASLAVYGATRYVGHDRRPELLAFVSLMVSICLWQLHNIVIDAATSVAVKLVTYNFSNTVSGPLFIYSVLWFALVYSGNERWVNRWTGGLVAGHMVTVGTAFVLAPEFMYEASGLVSQGPVTIVGVTFEQWVVLDRDLKPTFLLYQLYAYVVILTSGVVLGQYLLRNRTEVDPGQALALLVGIGTPLVANGLVFADVLPPSLNLTDVGFGVTSVAFAVAIFRYRLLELGPIGRQQVFETMDDPVIMLDEQRRVVDCNAAARRLVDAEAGWKGLTVEAFFAPVSVDAERFRDPAAVETEITLTHDGTTRHFDLNISPIDATGTDREGQLLVLREVTRRMETRRELRAQNERLDRFASIVSHDLRNPLNAAQFRAEFIEEEADEEHAAALGRNLDRMESMIDNLLTLSRTGETAENREPVDLGTVAAESWETVQTAGADFDLQVPEGTSVDADADRLRQVFENLFRNAVEHGSTSPRSQTPEDSVEHGCSDDDQPLTVRVGLLGAPASGENSPTGFFIEDDGDGIHPDERERVRERGFTTSGEGTGLGLSIVHDIVTAHDWEFTVTESRDGGARFEISDIEFGTRAD